MLNKAKRCLKRDNLILGSAVIYKNKIITSYNEVIHHK